VQDGPAVAEGGVERAVGVVAREAGEIAPGAAAVVIGGASDREELPAGEREDLVDAVAVARAGVVGDDA
jgi:hypothetical protein